MKLPEVAAKITGTPAVRDVQPVVVESHVDVVVDPATTPIGDVLKAGDKTKVGLDHPKREAPKSTASRRSVAKLLTAQVKGSRELDVMRRLHDLASTLDVDAAVRTAKHLGAGTFGATFDLGNGFVLKHFGDPTCTLGALAATMPPDAFTDMAKRQVAVHNALKDAGFPCVPAAIVAGHPTYVVMRKAEGLSFHDLTDTEKAQAGVVCEQLRAQIGEPTNAALRVAGFDVGDGIDTDVHPENARFARTPKGIAMSEFFDPTV